MGGKSKSGAIAKDIKGATAEQLAEQRRKEAEQRKILEAQKAQYMAFEFKNPYENMENVYEDLTVDTKAAEFQAAQGAQQRANIMAGMRGAAGASGVAGLAQMLAGQGTMQAAQISAQIGQQESRNRALAAKGAEQVQSLERQGAAQVQSAEAGRISTLLGMEMGEMAGARAGVQSAYANQMAGWGTIAGMENARMQANATMTAGAMNAAATLATSDRKIKKNIKHIFNSPSGLPVYSFEYIDSKHGDGVFQGVMADEVAQEAVFSHSDGYDMVDYSMIDVEFKKLK